VKWAIFARIFDIPLQGRDIRSGQPLGAHFVGQVLVPVALIVEPDQTHPLAVRPSANLDQIIVELRGFGEDPFDLKGQIASGGDDEGDVIRWPESAWLTVARVLAPWPRPGSGSRPQAYVNVAEVYESLTYMAR
jgi:hypothetical protein